MYSAASSSIGLGGSEAASTSSLGRPSATRAEKMVTFEDDLKSIATAAATATHSTSSSTMGTSSNLKLNADDVFM